MSYSNKHNRGLINGYVDFLKGNIYTKVASLNLEGWRTKEPVSFEERKSGEYIKLEEGSKWGDLWDCAWIHVTGTVPEEAAGKKTVLRIDLAGEGCVYTNTGYPITGITTYSSDARHIHEMPMKRIVDIKDCNVEDGKIDLWIDAGLNDLFGNLRNGGKVIQAEIAVCRENVRQLYYDYRFLSLLAETLDENSPRRNQIEYALFSVANQTDVNDDQSVDAARMTLGKHLEMENSDESLLFSAVGHSHIDLAWLWPIRETKRKGVRTFSTVLRLMEKYPDYIFGASQPQLYQWIKESQPGLYSEIKKRVEEGRWEPQGAMWVEPDTNVSGSEALVRQVLYGKKFFKQEFGKDMKILWLPDVFGYSAALPQIMKKSGVPYFMTIKLSWNNYNVFPHNTFIWQGLDGSEVLAHMPPENDYNSAATPVSLRNAERKFKDKDISNEALILFGLGDGGGGPSPAHLEFLKREKSVAGLPPTTQRPAIEFFESINENRDRYAKWCGELYLERHQGTYTTQSENKKYNRLMEFALRDCEFFCSMALVKAGFEYPQEEIEKIWKEVLLYQFHDILPGSSIKRVYNESVERYKELYNQVLTIKEKALEALAGKLAVNKGDTLAFNTLGFERKENVQTENGERLITVPAYGYAVIKDENTEDPVKGNVKSENGVIENKYIRAEFDRQGQLVSLYDKQAEREVLNKSYKGDNNLVIYDDKGDCWDMSPTYMSKRPESLKASSMETLEDGLIFTYEYNKSKFTQKVTLAQNAKKLVFDVYVDWQETFKMLRANYPVDINTTEARCNIQFGHISRPTHRNTSWDYAKSEICAHKWIDISECGYGVAMINNGKYGYNVWDNTLNIDLLRSPMHPGKDADKGEHRFSYELFIHDGDLLSVTEEAYKFNVALSTAVAKGTPCGTSDIGSFAEVSEGNVLIEAVKLAEDGDGLIVRLYECCGKRTAAKIRMEGITQAWLTSMIEEEQESLDVDSGTISLTFRPFEIHTVKVKY